MRNPSFLLPALLALGAGPALAQSEPLLDYGDPAFTSGQAFYSAAERRRIGALLKKADPKLAGELGESFVLLGDAEGAFPEPGSRVYLIQTRNPPASEPFPEGVVPVLLVTGKDGAATAFRLPHDMSYQRLVAAADGDRDGRDEVLVETSSTNMGQTVTSLYVVALDEDATARPVRQLEEVQYEGCDNPIGERSRSVSTISVGPDGYEVKTRTLPCS